MKRIEITTNGQVWLEHNGSSWTLSTPWEIVGFDSLDALPQVASAIHYALARFEGEKGVQRMWVEEYPDDDIDPAGITTEPEAV